MNFETVLMRITSADSEIRRTELLAVLREINAPFTHLRQQTGNLWPENIIISFGNSVPRYVIGAHYDSVHGSTGANDNGTGVCILLALVEYFLQYPPVFGLDCVFFDLEEVGLVGSQTYVSQVIASTIEVMINLDICGFGDTIAAALSQSAQHTFLEQTLNAIYQSEQHPLRIIEQMPPGDDVSFDRAGIPTVSVCAIPECDIENLIDIARCIQLQIPPGAMPTIMETMHNSSRDTIEVVEVGTMQRVFEFTLDLVQQMQKKN